MTRLFIRGYSFCHPDPGLTKSHSSEQVSEQDQTKGGLANLDSLLSNSVTDILKSYTTNHRLIADQCGLD